MTDSQTSDKSGISHRLRKYRHLIALPIILLAAYSLVYNGKILGSFDEIIRYFTAINLAQGRGFRAEYQDQNGEWSVYGDSAIPRYGFLHPLLATSLHLLSFANERPKHPDHPDATMVYEIPVHRRSLLFILWFNPLLATLLCVVFYLTGRRLNYSALCCFFTALALGFCTIIFAYTPLFYSEILNSLLAMLAFYFVMGNQQRSYLLCGLFAGLLPANNALFLLVVPLFSLYLLGQAGLKNRLKSLFLVLLGMLPGLLFLAYQISKRSGLGYSGELSFITPLAIGLFGNFLSPGKSIFIFSPIILLTLWGLRPFYQEHRWPALLSLGMIIIPLIACSKWHNWAGGTCWGPRLLIPIIPFMLLFTLPVMQGFRNYPAVLKSAILGLAMVSLGIQLLATVIPCYSWFHYTGRCLNIEMRDNRFLLHGINDELMLFQNTAPYFPEYCPPYLQGRAMLELLKFKKYEELTPFWISHRQYSWACIALLIIVGGFHWIMTGGRKEPE